MIQLSIGRKALISFHDLRRQHHVNHYVHTTGRSHGSTDSAPVSLSTVALLVGRLRMALFINYCFMLYWGYVFNFDLFVAQGVNKLTGYTVLYFSIGAVIVLLASVGLITHRA